MNEMVTIAILHTKYRGNMKSLTYIFCYVLTCISVNATEVPLENGIPISYVFSNMTATTEDTGIRDLRYVVTFGGNGYSQNESYFVRLYDNKNSESPFLTFEKTSFSETTRFTQDNLIGSSSIDTFQKDFEGRIEFELISGTISIISVKVIISDGEGGFLTKTMTEPEQIDISTTNGTPYIWLENLGYSSNWESADLEDKDNDGFLNWQEYTADTNPNDGSDFLTIDMSGGALNFDSSSYCRYSVEYCNNLNTGSWNLLTNNISGTADVIPISLSYPTQVRYYRVQAERIEN